MTNWFISRQGKLHGPYTLAQLQQLAHTAQLQPADVLCPEGGNPTRAERVPGLFAAPSAGVAQPVAVVAAPAAVAPPVVLQPAVVPPAPARGGLALVLVIGVVAGLFLIALACGGVAIAWTLL